MVRGNVVILPTRYKIVCGNTHKLTMRVLVFQENNNVIACIGLILASFTLSICSTFYCPNSFTFCCRTEIADF